MRSSRFAIILILAATLALVAAAGSQAELRFGPWVYWAPYYYPSPEKLQALGFKPEDFAPRYQSPNPLSPGSEGECLPAPPPPPRRVASRPPSAHTVRPPVRNRPHPAPSSVSRPTIRSAPLPAPRSVPQESLQSAPQTNPRSVSRPIEPARRPPAATPAPRSRFQWGSQDRPHAVTSAPGATSVVTPPRPEPNPAQ